ncbi:MAG TPA: Mur ligase family protein, partial [Polyangiaceae bacterium]
MTHELSRQLTTVGVTGTNGKTSTTRWTAACLARLASPVAQVTTLGSFLDDQPFDAGSDFEGFIRTMQAGVDRGGRFAAVEATSEALARGFARAWSCSIGIFTNLTRDHLDTHGSAEHYLASKAQLFVHL